MILGGKRKDVFIFTAAVVSVICVVVSSASFVADRYAARAERILDDPATEEQDVIDVREDTLSLYRLADVSWMNALLLAPLAADYRRDLADLHARIEIWGKTMTAMQVPVAGLLPEGFDSEDRSYVLMQQTLARDPSNAEHYLAMAHILTARGERESARERFLSAVELAPLNSPLRTVVATDLMNMGFPDDALEQARILARNDDSYKVDEGDTEGVVAREKRSSAYEDLLRRSYLFKALELVWRITNRDLGAVKATVPDNEDARAAFEMFLDDYAGDREGGTLGER